MKQWFSSDWRIGISIFLFALLIRFLYVFLIGDRFLIESGDQRHYERIALDFAQGNGFMPGSSYHHPLYPFLMGLFYKVVGHVPLFFKLFQAFLGSFIPLFLYRIGRNTFKARAGIIAALIALADPVLVHYTSQFLTETLFFFLFLGAIVFMSKPGIIEKSESRNLKSDFITLAAIGILLGLGTLCRSILFLFPLAIGLWFLIQGGFSSRRSLQRTAIVWIFFLLTLTPWMVRNFSVHGKFLPVTTNFGVNLWIGNNPEATGGYFIPETQIDFSFENLSEWERNQKFLAKAVGFAVSNPMDFLSLFIKKLRLFWTPYPHFTTRFAFWILMPLSIVGVFLSWKRYPSAKFFLLTIFYFYISTALFFTAHRFFVPVIPFLILYASFTLAHLSRHRPMKKDKKRVCIVRHYYYPQDSHVVRNAETLKEAGYDVEVICLRNFGERGRDRINGIEVYRLPVHHHRGSLFRYLLEYSTFFILSGIVLTFRYLVRRYEVIEIDNLPDFLIFITIIPKLLGAKVVLYMFEPMPELFQSKFRVKRQSLSIKFITFLERLSTQYADTVIAFSEPFYQVQLSRGLPPSKGSFIYSVPNDRVLNIELYSSTGRDGKNGFVLLYHGTLLKRYGLQDLIQAIVLLKDRIPGLHLEILGEGEYLPTLSNLVKHLGISDQVHFRGYIPYNQIPQAINNADLGIVPMVLNDHTNLTIPIKLFEYVAMKRPVIATRTQAIQVLFDETCILYFESSNVKQLADRISDLYCSPQKRQILADNAYTQYQKIKWSSVKEKYCQLIDPSRESEYPE